MLPKTRAGLYVEGLVVASALVAYAIRVVFYISLRETRGPSVPFDSVFCSALFCGIVFVLPYLAWLLYLSIFKAKHIFPVILIVLGCVFVINAPMLPLALPPLKPFPEEIAFAEHREDYEYIVSLAHNRELIHDDSVINPWRYFVPEGYEHLVYDDWLWVDYQSEGLIIEIAPFDFYYPLVYVERPELIDKTQACHYDGNIERTIDENWYLCTRWWN